MKPAHKCESPGGTGPNANPNLSLNPANCAVNLGARKAVSCFKRAAMFIQLCLVQRSIARALWVDAYENFIPRHGK